MLVPFQENRYFTGGVDPILLHDTTLYSADEYDIQFPFIVASFPNVFSINLNDAIVRFLTTAPPYFGVQVADVLEVACFFYSDWESVIAVTDEFIQTQDIEKARQELLQINPSRAEEWLQDQIAVLGIALKELIELVIGVLCRVQAPAIIDYGCCYRPNVILDDGTVLFQLSNPSIVHADLEEDAVALRAK